MICGMVWYQQKGQQQYQTSTTPDPQNPTADPNQLTQTLPQKGPKVNELALCIKCYTDGNIPNIFSPNDFYKVDLLNKINPNSTKLPTAPTWNQEETLKLLELIQKYPDNWNDIQKYFPNKTREEIILHYMQLPVKNVTSLNILDIGDDRAEELTPPEKLAENPPTVFSDYSNPILQHVNLNFKVLIFRLLFLRAI
jgi:hypothetical protein